MFGKEIKAVKNKSQSEAVIWTHLWDNIKIATSKKRGRKKEVTLKQRMITQKGDINNGN